MPRKTGSGTKSHKLLKFNKSIDRPEAFTRAEKMKWLDEYHRKLFPEKYNELGERVEV